MTTHPTDAAPDSRPASFTRDPIAGEPRPGDPWPEIALRHAETVNLEAVYGCNICGAEFPGNGFIHYCRRTPDAPRAGGPGGERKAEQCALCNRIHYDRCMVGKWIDRLTSENASLRSENARLAGVVDESKRQARIEALEWALDACHTKDSEDYIEAEIQHLQAAPGGEKNA